MSITAEMIAAFADGELEDAERAVVEAALAADPALGRKIAAHRALKDRLTSHYAPIAEATVPTHLAALLDSSREPANASKVVSFAAARQKRGLAPMVRRWAPVAGPALAASLILAIWQPWQARTPEGYAGGDLATALETQLAAAQPADAPTRILISFVREGGGLCRAYRSGETGGIACRDTTGWKIERRFELQGPDKGQFRQAGSEAELLTAAQDMAAGEAFDAEAERAAKAQGWAN